MVCIFHDWSKWVEYKVSVKEALFWEDIDKQEWGIQVRQKRECLKCGKMQDRQVR